MSFNQIQYVSIPRSLLPQPYIVVHLLAQTGPGGEDTAAESKANGAGAEDKPATNGGSSEAGEGRAAGETSGGIDLVPAADDEEEDEEQKKNAVNGGGAVDGEHADAAVPEGGGGGGEDASAPAAEGMPEEPTDV